MRTFKEFINEDQLDESRLKKAIAAMALAATAATVNHSTVPSAKDTVKQEYSKAVEKTKKTFNDLAASIKSIHPHIKDTDAEMHVKLAEKYADPVFPKKEDILAVMGIESHHKNGLKSNAGAVRTYAG
jgi:hypothetical protein